MRTIFLLDLDTFFISVERIMNPSLKGKPVIVGGDPKSGKGVVAACTKNETVACQTRPIVDCHTSKVPTFYYASENETNVLFLDTCIIVSGEKEELLRATDRMLFHLLQIMP